MSYEEKSSLYQLFGPLGVILLLTACFLLCVNTLCPDSAVSDIAAADTLDTGGAFLGLSGCVLVGSVVVGFIAILTLKKEVSS